MIRQASVDDVRVRPATVEYPGEIRKRFDARCGDRALTCFRYSTQSYNALFEITAAFSTKFDGYF